MFSLFDSLYVTLIASEYIAAVLWNIIILIIQPRLVVVSFY